MNQMSLNWREKGRLKVGEQFADMEGACRAEERTQERGEDALLYGHHFIIITDFLILILIIIIYTPYFGLAC